MTTESRREFEEWAESKNFSLPKGNRYISPATEIAWEAWQAAREQVTEQRDRLAEAVNAATILIAAKGRHNTMLAYNGLRDALQSLTPKDHE
jgi:predicted DsbA family dithiol-disulfide isomerase